MPKVAFKNIADTTVTYEIIEEEYLLPAIRSYARLQSDDRYKTIMQEKVSILHNGQVIHPDNWAFFEVKEEDEIIITPVLSGDEVGGFIQLVVGLVFIAVGTVYDQPWLISLGIALAFGGLSSMLFKPDLPNLNLDPGKPSQTYNWSGIKTIAQADSPIPVIYGTHKVGGNIISLFSDVDGNDSYLYMLLALSEGEIDGICQKNDHTQVCITSQYSSVDYVPPAIEIDDQPLDYYNNITWWYRTGTNTADGRADTFYPFSQNSIPYFDDSRVQISDGRELSTSGIEYTTSKEVDSVGVKIQCPSLFDSSSGTLQENTVTFKVQYRLNGESTWIDANVYRYTAVKTAVGTTTSSFCTCNGFINGPYIYSKPPDYTITILSNSFNSAALLAHLDRVEYTIKISIKDSYDNITLRDIVNIVYRRYYIWKDSEPGTTDPGQWVEVSAYEYSLRWDWQYVDCYTSIAYQYTTFYVNNYKVTLSQNVVAGNSWTLSSVQNYDTTTNIMTGLSKTPLYRNNNIDFDEIGIYDIKVRRTDGGKSDAFDIGNNLILDSVIETVQGNFIYPNTALLALKIKATGQLSGSPPNITTIVHGMKISVPSLSGSEDFNDCFWNEDNNRWEYAGNERTWDNSTYETEYSENSILCVRDLILADRYGLGSYIESNDISSSGILTAIKECHKSWNIDTADLLAWWDIGGSIFDRKISYSDTGISIDSVNKKISLSSTTNYLFYIKLSSPLEKEREYSIDVTLDSLSISSCTITVYGKSISSTISLISTITSATDGSNPMSYTPAIDGIYELMIQIEHPTSIFSVDITDISITPTIADRIHNHTYNGVLETLQAAETALLEMCESFRCWPVWHSGTYNFIIDIDDTPIHTLSMGNTIEFSQSFTPISNIPYKLIGEYCDAAQRYEMRSLQTRSTDTTLNKLNEITVGLKGISNRKKAERELKHKHNRVINNTHTIEVKCGLDFLHGTAGDIINIQDDLPAWGQGGRVLDYNSTAIIIDKAYTWNNVTASYLIRYQKEDNSFVNATLNASGSDTQTITITNLTASPKADSVYALGLSTTYIKPFRLISAERGTLNEVSFVALEHTPAIYTESSVTVIEDTYTTLSDPLSLPSPPLNPFVTQLGPLYGIGFEFNAIIPPTDIGVREIVVQMSQVDYYGWETVALIPAGEKTARYINNSLIIVPPNNIYHFKFFCRSQFKDGPAVEIRDFELDQNVYQLPVVSGLTIKGSDVHSTTFNGRDVTIIWNTVGSSYLATSLSSFGYKINVYHTLATNANLLRTVFTKTEEYTYTLENNLEDSGLSTPYSTLIFVVYAIAQGFSSSTYRSITVNNSFPNSISGLTAIPIIGGVKFKWTKSTEVDFKNYYQGTKVNNGSWSSWADYEDNEYLRTLTADEIELDKRADVYIRVKAKDWYDQLSTVASITASANTVSDNLFQLVCSVSSGVTGNVASLYDSRLSTGGVTIIADSSSSSSESSESSSSSSESSSSSSESSSSSSESSSSSSSSESSSSSSESSSSSRSSESSSSSSESSSSSSSSSESSSSSSVNASSSSSSESSSSSSESSSSSSESSSSSSSSESSSSSSSSSESSSSSSSSSESSSSSSESSSSSSESSSSSSESSSSSSESSSSSSSISSSSSSESSSSSSKSSSSSSESSSSSSSESSSSSGVGGLYLRQAYSAYEANSIASVNVIAGDLIIVGYSYGAMLDLIECYDNASGSSNSYLEASTTWHLYDVDVAGHVFYAIAKATETLTITCTDQPESGLSIHVVSGAHDTLEEVLNTYDSNWTVDSTNHSSQSITTDKDDCYLFCFWAQGDTSSTVAEDGTGFTERTEESTHVHASFDRVVEVIGTYNNDITSSASQGFINIICAFNSIGWSSNSSSSSSSGSSSSSSA